MKKSYMQPDAEVIDLVALQKIALVDHAVDGDGEGTGNGSMGIEDVTKPVGGDRD